jgi:ABC-type multidrug transport system ATPase subunit/pSer/pThr/pTyr-binding forkhead associated (FHA) protein
MAASDGALLVIQEDATSRVVPLSGQALTIGRSAENDIQLPQPFVSTRHARIEPHGASHRVVDLNSTNGLRLAGERINECVLRDGDALRVGDESIGSLVTLLYLNPRAPGSAQIEQFPLGPQQSQWTIGRVGCDIVLANPQVSRFHAQIDRLPDGRFLLRNTSSSIGTAVNGQSVSQHLLAVGDIIQIGPFRLTFTGAALERSERWAELHLGAYGITRVVQRDGQDVPIVQDVSLAIAPREFVALVGGSGAGKSTLLKALCGVVAPSGGTVRVNGDDLYGRLDDLRPLIGYVPQDDTIHRALPVEQALRYTARLRLPKDTSAAEMAQRVERVLALMELTEHRHKRVDQLSGGQRKRVCIAAELIAEPGICFLDEATSGLDPGLEKRLMYTLRQLADSGRTVVLVTHATENIALCDKVAFLAQGRLVFFGTPAEALAFFQVTSGNFADIYLKLEGQANPNSQVVREDLAESYRAWRAANPQAQAEPGLGLLWEHRFRSAEPYQRNIVERLARQPASSGVGSGRRAAGASSLRQLAILARRYGHLIWQDRRYLLLLLLQAPLIGLLAGLVTPPDALTSVVAAELSPRNEARKALFMLLTAAIWFGVSNAALEIVKERLIVGREWMASTRVGAYLGSKFAVLGLLALLQSALLLLAFGAQVTLRLAQPLLLPLGLELFITLALTALAATALGLAISAAARTPEQAAGGIPLAIIPQLLCAGLLFAIDSWPTQILSWFAISRWGMDALGTSVSLTQFCHLPNLADDQTGCLVAPPQVPDAQMPAALSFGEDGQVLAAFSFQGGHLLTMWAILAIFLLAAATVAHWQLRRQRRRFGE